MTRPALVVGLGAAALGVVLVGVSAPGRRAISGRVGRFFTWAELTASDAGRRLGLDNTPPPEAMRAMEVLVAYVLDPLRAVFGSRLRVTSGYRSPAVNEAVDGSTTSQHMRGEAVDFVVDGLSSEQVARVMVRGGLPFDQLIWYLPERGGHVHVSLTRLRPNRSRANRAP